MVKLRLLLTVVVSIFVAAVCSGETVPATTSCTTSECHDSKGGAKQLEAAALVKKHCTTCHTESRILDKLKAMHKDQHDSFEKSVKSIIVKKIRLTGGEINHRDGKKILEYLANLYG